MMMYNKKERLMIERTIKQWEFIRSMDLSDTMNIHMRKRLALEKMHIIKIPAHLCFLCDVFHSRYASSKKCPISDRNICHVECENYTHPYRKLKSMGHVMKENYSELCQQIIDMCKKALEE